MRLCPAYMFLQYTTVCQSRCTTCHLWAQPPETIPVEVLERIDRFFNPTQLGSIFFTGGESLLPPTCVDIARVLNRWKPGIRLVGSTNGICPELYVSRMKQMRDEGIQIRMAVSLNGLPATHDKSRGYPGNYGLALETARGLKEIGALASLNILFIPNETTAADLHHVMALAQDLGVPAWSSPVLRHSPWFGEEDDGAEIERFENCQGATRVFTIRPNGDITACQEPRPQLTFCNLRDEGLDPEKVARIQEIVRTGKCQPCGCCTVSFSKGLFVS